MYVGGHFLRWSIAIVEKHDSLLPVCLVSLLISGVQGLGVSVSLLNHIMVHKI